MPLPARAAVTRTGFFPQDRFPARPA